MTAEQNNILLTLQQSQGRKFAMTGKSLAMFIYGFNTNKYIKVIQKDILSLRQDGYPICAADKEPMGYYLPATVDEANSFFYQCKARAKSTFTTVANVAKGLKKMFPEQEYQLNLDI